MTRNGKIARLPRHLRDELNRRLDNGEQGVRLVEWLNTLPEVKQAIETDFGGHAITEGNLTQWKQGGFLEWQNRQEARAYIQDLKSDDDELSKVPAAELADPLITVLTALYAAACHRSNTDDDEDPRETVRRLGKSLRDMIRVRRCELARERAQIERERARQLSEFQRDHLALDRQWLELEQSKIKNQQSKIQTTSAPDLDSMTPQERSEHIKKIIYGD